MWVQTRKKVKRRQRKKKEIITATTSTKKNDCAHIKWQEVNLIICTIAIWLNVRQQMQLLRNFVRCLFVGASALRLSIGIWNEMHSVFALNVFGKVNKLWMKCKTKVHFAWPTQQLDVCKLHLDIEHIHFIMQHILSTHIHFYSWIIFCMSL